MFVYPPGNDHIPYLRKRNIDSSSCLLGGDMLVPWRVDTSKLLVCSHRAGGTNVKDLSEVFLLHEFIVRKKFTNLHKETFSTPRVSYIHFMGTQKSSAPHLGPAGGKPVSTRGSQGHLSAFGRPISLSFGRKKEDGPRRDPLAKPGGTAGFSLCCYGVVCERQKNARKRKSGFKKSEGFFWSPGATRRKNARW